MSSTLIFQRSNRETAAAILLRHEILRRRPWRATRAAQSHRRELHLVVEAASTAAMMSRDNISSMNGACSPCPLPGFLIQ